MKYIEVPKGQGDEIETPPWLYEELNAVFHFGWDAAATKENTWTGDFSVEDCLEVSWEGRGPVFLNPPYSKPGPFLMTASYYMTLGVTTVALIKGDPSTKWWNKYVKPFAQLKWIEKRICFYYKGQPTKHAANFPSVLAFYWGFPMREYDNA